MKLPNTVRHSAHLTVLVCGGPDYTDEYTLFDHLDRLLWECEDHGLQMIGAGRRRRRRCNEPRMGPPQQRDHALPDRVDH
jgi:hypothetical protein